MRCRETADKMQEERSLSENTSRVTCNHVITRVQYKPHEAYLHTSYTTVHYLQLVGTAR
jgi:hypothetical protein